VISAVCLTAIGLSALVVGGASSSPVVAQTAPIDTVAGIVNAVIAGGTYTVKPGTYQLTGTLNISKQNTRLDSAVPGQAVVLVAAAGSRVVNVSATGVVINGFTITGGSVPTGNGGGINVASRAGLSLLNSTVTVNSARDGGGISSDGLLVVENSTINRNVASGKGGGIRDNGTSSATVTTSILNSTFNDNTASQGGALSSAGRSTIVHATIVGNKATNSSSAGVDRNGGTLVVRSSIIGANIRLRCSRRIARASRTRRTGRAFARYSACLRGTKLLQHRLAFVIMTQEKVFPPVGHIDRSFTDIGTQPQEVITRTEPRLLHQAQSR